MEKQFYLFKYKNEAFKIDLQLVTHISVDDYVLTIHCLDGTVHSCCSSLKSMKDEMPPAFKKINRSCLVNCALIQSIHGKEIEITMQNDLRLPVAKSKWKAIKKDFIQINHLDNGIQDIH